MDHAVVKHYDFLIEENNDPVRDPEPLKAYMDLWDGREFIEKMKLTEKSSVLEIGVGTGRLAMRTAPLCAEFFGIDVSPKTIERAEENLRSCGKISLICGDFLDHDFCRVFDVVYSSLTFMHIKEKQTAINKVAALLADGGRFVLSIDKNQDKFLDIGTSKIEIYPDSPNETAAMIERAGMKIEEKSETQFAHIFVCVRSDPAE